MDNIYDIRKKENLLFVIPQSQALNIAEESVLKQTAIVVNLYYLDTVEQYMEYLNAVDSRISIYVFSSSLKVLEKVRALSVRPILMLQKDNRGRDISALLVEFREFVQKYDYLCFVHDKAAKSEYLADDVTRWIKNMWDNTLASETYISNVLGLLSSRSDLGLLVPPEPLGEYIDAWYGDAWKKNYCICKELAEKLQLNCMMQLDKQPITLSTVFWAKTQALDKLLKYEWAYEDFPEEPMSNDGTISHAIERILGYVAQDAGYKTGTIMTSGYAAWNLLLAQDGLRMAMKVLNKQNIARSIHDTMVFDVNELLIKDFFNNSQKVYLYGAGEKGNQFLAWCKEWKLSIAGFVVSDNQVIKAREDGYNVYRLKELNLTKDDGIIITVDRKMLPKIESELRHRNISKYIYGF